MPSSPADHRRRPRLRHVLVGLVAAVALTACGADEGLVDRVAELENSQDALRSTITDLTGPVEGTDGTEVALAEVTRLVDRVDALEEELQTALTAGDAGSLLIDDRLTGLELADAARASTDEQILSVLTGLQESVDALTDSVSSLEAQFEAHRDSNSAHGG